MIIFTETSIIGATLPCGARVTMAVDNSNFTVSSEKVFHVYFDKKPLGLSGRQALDVGPHTFKVNGSHAFSTFPSLTPKEPVKVFSRKQVETTAKTLGLPISQVEKMLRATGAEVEKDPTPVTLKAARRIAWEAFEAKPHMKEQYFSGAADSFPSVIATHRALTLLEKILSLRIQRGLMNRAEADSIRLDMGIEVSEDEETSS